MELSAEGLIGGFADLRQDGTLCDITLQAEGKSIVAHRALLAAASPYFRAMFGGNFKEAKEDIINLDALGVSSVGLSAVVDCVYSLKLNITQENYVAVTKAVNLLQFVAIVPLCEKFLQSHIDTQNCIQILQLCETHGMKSAEHAVDIFLLDNFITMSKQNPDFVEMSKECLVRCITNTELSTSDEIEVYRAVMEWIRSAPLRDEHMVELMSHIRMHHIPLDVITDELAKEPLLKCSGECTKQLKQAIGYHNFPCKQTFSKMLPPRGELAMIMLDTSRVSLLSHNTSADKRYQWYLRPFPSFGKNIATMDQSALPAKANSFSDVSIGNFSYFICSYETEHSHMRYDPVLDKWLTLAPVPVPRNEVPDDFFYESVQDFILLGGGLVMKKGRCQPPGSLSMCYMYSVEHNTWMQTIDLPVAMHGGLTCVHNNCLYITSYDTELFTNDEPEICVKKLWMFDSGKMIWSEKAAPLKKHDGAIFAASHDKLILAGGWYEDDYGETRNQETAEVYDIKSDQWSNILSLHPNFNIPLLCRIAGRISIANDRSGNIYVFGERDDEDGPDTRCVAVVFNLVSGVVSIDQNWVCKDKVLEKTLVTVPKGRFKPECSEILFT